MKLTMLGEIGSKSINKLRLVVEAQPQPNNIALSIGSPTDTGRFLNIPALPFKPCGSPFSGLCNSCICSFLR